MKQVIILIAAIIAIIVVGAPSATTALPPPQSLPVDIREVENYALVNTSSRPGSQSQLFQINVAQHASSNNKNFLKNIFGQQQNQTTTQPDYGTPPYLLVLKAAKRTDIGYDYADLMAEQTSFTFDTFLHALSKDASAIKSFMEFTDMLWNKFYVQHVPKPFLNELAGMDTWAKQNPTRASKLYALPHEVSRRFYVLANMPADLPNIISGLEREFERGWPSWLKTLVNDIIKILEKYVHSCDAYGVWGSRTSGNTLYTSRNLDYNSNTGINRFKLITVFDIQENARHKYATIGFSFGPGALAGMNKAGITTSEMNLDNSQVTYSGLPFPLRLRYILENANNLQSAMTLWNATNNTNSFNFLIGSASDKAAYALETMFNFTAQFPANSPVEANAFFDCGQPPHVNPTCKGWTKFVSNKTTGNIPIGFPLPEAVWRTNHGVNPTIMKTQENLFGNTIQRYMIMHDLFNDYEKSGNLIRDLDAVNIVATLGIKGESYFTCDQAFQGDNVMSIAYVPGEGRLFAAWELGGVGGGGNWRPAACAPYVHIDFSRFWN